MPLTVQNIFGLLLRSRLLSVNDAKSLFQRWQNEAKEQAGDLERFRRWLVHHRYLTEYQANLLCRGHADGFFVGDYKILDRLGRGRMAGVYKGVHSLGQVVAIKVLPPSKARDSYLMQRFDREGRLALRVKHVNVVRSFQLGTSDNLHYIVMEYLEGETLEDALHRRRRLPPGEAVRVVYQVLQGLQHIHEQGMVHRDLKPSNLMLVPGRVQGQVDTTLHSTVKILDIGLGRAFFDENAQVPSDDPQLTGEGVLLGTPDYLAPEQARNARAVDIRADIYSMGCVLYHCLAGHPPFPDTNIINQMIRHAQEAPKPLKELNPEVPDSLQMVVNYMLAKDANQRYPTPAQAAQALQPFLAGGAELPRAVEPDASMTQYLTWLENNSGGPHSAALPVARPVPAATTKKKKKGSRSGRRKLFGRSKKDRQTTGEAGKRKKGLVSGDFDVELVGRGGPAPMATVTLPAGSGVGFTRRDVLLLAAGAGSVALVAAVGGLLASGSLGTFLHKLGLGGEDESPSETKKK